MSRPHHVRHVLAGMFTAGALVLTGCATADADTDLPTTDTEVTVEEESAPKNDRALVEVALPDDFPDVVPLYDGPLTKAQSVEMGEDKTMYWSLTIRTDDAPTAMQTVRADMVEAGFDEKTWSEMGDLVSGLWEAEELRISAQSARDINGHALLYTVMEK